MKTRIDEEIMKYFSTVVEQQDMGDNDVINLLSIVREAFHMDVVYILENTRYRNVFAYTYYCKDDTAEDGPAGEIRVSEADYEKMRSYYLKHETGTEQYESTKAFYKKNTLRFALIKQNAYLGEIGFQRDEDKPWTEEEREALCKLGRAVRLYIYSKQKSLIGNEDFKEFLDALTNATISDYYVDLVNNTCYAFKTLERLKHIIPNWGSYDEIIQKYARQCLDSEYQEELISKFDRNYLRNCLTPQNRITEMDYRREVDGKSMWFRQAATLVDTDEKGMPYHVIISVKDVTDILTDEDRNRYALMMLKDSYYRICAIDPVNNYFANIKQIDDEEKESALLNHHLEEMVNFIAENRVHPKDKDKFLNILSPSNLEAFFEESKETIAFNYRRLIRGEYQWVRSEVVPLDYYGTRNTQAIWYVKNVSEEMVKKADLTGRLLESNAKLRNLLESEAQFRQAILSDTMMVYRFNLTKNVIEEEIINDEKKGKESIFHLLEREVPCDYNEFMHRVRELVFEESLETFDELISCEKLIREFKKGRENITVEYKIKDVRGKLEHLVLRQTNLFMESIETGNIVGICFVKDVTELRNNEYQAKATLQLAYEAASRANSAKTDFLSKMSHDIRTPMNAIIGMTAIATAHIDDKERVQDSLGKIEVSSKHLLSLINEVLDMSKIESGKIKLSEDKFNLAQLIDNLLDICKLEIKQKNHNLKVNIKRIWHEDVIGDSMRIQQVFVNVMSNAVKYTEDGGEIVITISENETNQEEYGCYEFIFEDNGIGMSPEFMEHIFEPFTRAENDSVNKIQGTGLGMAITKNIVQMMNGTIDVESKIGKGTKFTLTIFLKVQKVKMESADELKGLRALVAGEDIDARGCTCAILEEMGMLCDSAGSNEEALTNIIAAHETGKDYFVVVLDGENEKEVIRITKDVRQKVDLEVPRILISSYDWSEMELDARAAGADEFVCKPLFQSRLTRAIKNLIKGEEKETVQNPLEMIQEMDYSDKKVLLVEDNELNREIAVAFLEMTGIQVEEAFDGKEAVNKFIESPPRYYDLIFMDIQMPIMNGYEATSAIRSLDRWDAKRIPIIAMTANAFVEDVQAAESVGMNEHMAKPIDIARLSDILKRWLN